MKARGLVAWGVGGWLALAAASAACAPSAAHGTAATASTAVGPTPALAPAPGSGSADAVALLHQRLQLAPVLSGEFEQTKTLQGFKNPLVSHGEFLVARGQGVWWHTLQPFESTLVVTRERLFTRGADGQAANVMEGEAEPGLRQVETLVLALLGGDIEALAERFTLQGQAVGTAGWAVTLRPREPALARFLAGATLTGERSVQSVRIDEARGDSTLIRFSHQATAPALTPAAAARLR